MYSGLRLEDIAELSETRENIQGVEIQDILRFFKGKKNKFIYTITTRLKSLNKGDISLK